MDGDEAKLTALAGALASREPNVVPFGKYRGQPVAAMRQDRNYMDWLAGQDGILRSYPWIFSVTVNAGAAPAETPEHNRYQALFLDREFVEDFYDYLLPGKREQSARWQKSDDEDWQGPIRPTSVGVDFERCFLRDVGVGYRRSERTGAADVSLWLYLLRDCDPGDVRIEIKPAMGDDYPAVLRQMQHNACNVLYLVNYTGSGATLEQVREMFRRSGILVVMHSVFWE